jgi:hypothetical protein
VSIQGIALAAGIWVILFGLAASWIAARRDRVRPLWFGYGAILGPVAVILVWLAPRGYCPVCLTPGRGWLTTCWWCGSGLRGSSTGRPRPAPTGPASSQPVPSAPAPPEPAPVGVMDPAVVSDARPAKRRRRQRGAAVEGTAGTVAPWTGPDSTEMVSEVPPVMPAVSDPIAQARRATSSSGAVRVEPTSLSGGPAPLERSEGIPTIEPEIPAAVAPGAATERPSPILTEPGPVPQPRPEPHLISTAVYFAGSPRLEIGARYGLIIDGSQFKIVGPYDPTVVAFERPLAGLAATVNLGRVLLAFPDGRGSIAVVFTALAGATPQQVVETLLKAAARASE